MVKTSKCKNKVTVIDQSSSYNVTVENAPTELFSDIKDSDRRSFKLNLKYEISAGKSVRFVGLEPLGLDDLQVLQGIVSLLEKKNAFRLSAQGELKDRLNTFLETDVTTLLQAEISMQTTIALLLAATGLENNTLNSEHVLTSIERLSRLGIVATENRRFGYFTLINKFVIDGSAGNVFVAINPHVVLICL